MTTTTSHRFGGVEERWMRAAESRDPRFDGWVYIGVSSTGIYCRPSCPARSPKRENMRFFASAASAQSQGFRACKRCRPDASPGSPEWDRRGDVAARAMRLIRDGVVDREGVAGLARQLGYAPRHIQRVLVGELGAGPMAIARAQRAQTARLLLETTAIPVTDVAHAAGFGSARQLNHTMHEVFSESPTGLRLRSRHRERHPDLPVSPITLHLAHRAPFAASWTMRYLTERAMPGVEAASVASYRRGVRLDHGPALIDLAPLGTSIRLRAWLSDLRDLQQAVARCRRLLDLDADPIAIADVLGRDPNLRPLVVTYPGLRVPGASDPGEIAIRTVLGQQVSVAAARTMATRLVAAVGERVPRLDPEQRVTHLFPTMEQIAEHAHRLPLPAARRDALARLASAIATGALRLDPGADRDQARHHLAALKGIGPWTIEYIAMRGLGDPDAYPATDLGVRRALASLRIERGRDPAWRPWRAYATQYFWQSLTPEEA